MRETALIFRKEIARFLSNRASAAVAVLLPGALIYLMWTAMGSIFAGWTAQDPAHVAVVGPSETARSAIREAGMDVVEVSSLPSAEDMRRQVREGEVQAFVAFPEGFDEGVRSFAQGEGAEPLQVELYYSSGSDASLRAYEELLEALDDLEDSVSDVFDVNAGEGPYDVATERDQASFMVVSVMPFMLLTLVFSSCVSVASESVAGEKERGTLATLFATPARRRDIALGKALACSLIALVVAASSALGILAGLPSVMGGRFDLGVYGPAEYVLVGLVALSVTLLVNVLVMIVSALAKTTKEAQTYLVPAMVVVMGVGLLGMAGDGAQGVLWAYVIPLYNGVEAMIGILSFDYSIACVALCLASNAALTALGIAALGRLFESERIMFAR